MKYILDASVSVRWFLESNDFDKARHLQNRFPFVRSIATL